jgi:biopolymer transport protein TolQ
MPQLTASIAAATATLSAGLAPDASGAASEAPRLDPVQLVLQASVPVKVVMALLVGFSLACWLVIGVKALHIARAKNESDRFLKAFDTANSFDAIVDVLAQFRGSPFARIFAVGYDEFARVCGGHARPLDDAQGAHVESVTRRAATKEVDHLESWMSLLGTIGSTSPFIGLFGTVYGIMDAFLSIGNQQNANLPVVAPKIAEALIATAIGLVAAIPAVMAYNYFARRVQQLSDSLDSFAADVAARAKLGGI